MPEMKPGREKIRQFLKDNCISITDLATAYGVSRQEMTQALDPKQQRPKYNQLILKIISDFGIK